MAGQQQKETASQKYRRKLKENPKLLANHLRRERARDLKRREVMRKNMEENEGLKMLARMRSKERMQATRERRKEAKIGRTSVSYKNSRTLGKAVAKVKRNLPASPTKAVEVVKKIAAEFQVAVINPPKTMPSKSIDEVKEKIRNFYERDDISRQMPGIKEAKSIKTSTGEKLRIQKRTMIMSVREAFELFQTSFPEISIGKTLFYNERPAYVLKLKADKSLTIPNK